TMRCGARRLRHGRARLRRGARARLSRPRPAGGRRDRRAGPGRGHDLVHPAARTGLCRLRRDRRGRRAGRYRPGRGRPERPAGAACAAEAAAARHLQGELARHLGRYAPHDRRFQLYGRAVSEATAVIRFIQFAAAMLAFGTAAFRVYVPEIDEGFARWLAGVIRMAAVAAFLASLAMVPATAADMAGSAGAAASPATLGTVLFATQFGHAWCWHLGFG